MNKKFLLSQLIIIKITISLCAQNHKIEYINTVPDSLIYTVLPQYFDDFEKTKNLLLLIDKLYHESNDSQGQALVLVAYSTIELYSGNFINYDRLMKQLISIEESTIQKINFRYFTITNAITRYYLERKQFKESFLLLEKLISEEHNNPVEELKAVIKDKLAELYFLTGEYEKAKNTLLNNITYKKLKLKSKPYTIADSYFLLARIYFKLKDYDNAISTLNICKTILSHKNSSQFEKTLFNSTNLLLLECELKHKNNKHRISSIIMEINTKSNLTIFQKIKFYSIKILCHIKSNNLEKAKIELKNAQLLISKLKDENFELRNIPKTYYECACLYFNKISEPLKCHRLINNTIRETVFKRKGNNIELIIDLQLLNLENLVGTEESNLQNLIIKQIIKLDSNFKQLKVKIDEISYKKYLNFISLSINFFLIKNQIALAFQFMEENKSNLLAKSLNDAQAKGYANIPQHILDQERDYRANLNFYSKKSDELQNDTTIDSQIKIDLGDAVNRYQIKLDKLIDSLEQAYPQYHAIKYGDLTMTVEMVQEMLEPHTGFIEYFVGPDSAYVASITKDEYYLTSIPNFDSLITPQLSEFGSLVRDPSTAAETLLQSGKTIYDKILKPALDSLNTDLEKLIVVQDDKLNNIPFELMSQDGIQYLQSNYNIHYQYSAKLWKLLREKESQNYTYDLTGFAYTSDNPNFMTERSCSNLTDASLLCSTREINDIKEIFEDKVTSCSHDNIDILLDRANNSRILHLATHSCLDSSDYNQSKIYFSEGHLTYADLQLKNLNTELAVISSCESGYGKVIKGEGAMSIAKAFFTAGAKSTIVSLWPVDDCSTSDIMKYFYQGLKNGKTKDSALHEAKQKYLESAHPSRMHPYYWAGFVLIGDSSPVWESADSWKTITISALVLLLALFTYGYLKKKNGYST